MAPHWATVREPHNISSKDQVQERESEQCRVETREMRSLISVTGPGQQTWVTVIIVGQQVNPQRSQPQPWEDPHKVKINFGPIYHNLASFFPTPEKWIFNKSIFQLSFLVNMLKMRWKFDLIRTIKSEEKVKAIPFFLLGGYSLNLCKCYLLNNSKHTFLNLTFSKKEKILWHTSGTFWINMIEIFSCLFSV